MQMCIFWMILWAPWTSEMDNIYLKSVSNNYYAIKPGWWPLIKKTTWNTLMKWLCCVRGVCWKEEVFLSCKTKESLVTLLTRSTEDFKTQYRWEVCKRGRKWKCWSCSLLRWDGISVERNQESSDAKRRLGNRSNFFQALLELFKKRNVFLNDFGNNPFLRNSPR